MKNLWLPKETGWEREGLVGGVWGGNVVKLGCDDGCTTVNILKFTELKKVVSMMQKNGSVIWKTE